MMGKIIKNKAIYINFRANSSKSRFFSQFWGLENTTS